MAGADLEGQKQIPGIKPVATENAAAVKRLLTMVGVLICWIYCCYLTIAHDMLVLEQRN